MSKTRRRFSAEFKTRVALDALSGEHTLSELASKYGVHPNQVSQWKKQAKEQIAAGFAGTPPKGPAKRRGKDQGTASQDRSTHGGEGFFATSLRQDLSCERRRAVVDKSHPELSIRRQCRILKLHRSTYYYDPIGESAANLALMRRIDELFMELPFFGSRQMRISCGTKASG